MSTNQDALKAWARSLFAPDDNGDQDDDEQERQVVAHDDGRDDEQERQVVAHDDGRDEERRFATALFAPDDPAANILAGLVAGRAVGRTTPPRT